MNEFGKKFVFGAPARADGEVKPKSKLDQIPSTHVDLAEVEYSTRRGRRGICPSCLDPACPLGWYY